MKSVLSRRFSILVVALIALAAASPAHAKKAPVAPPADATTNAADSPTVSAPATPAASAPAPAAKAAPVPSSNSVTVGEVTISHMSAETSKGHIDIFLTIKNAGKADEKVTGAGSTWDIADIVEVKKDKDGKEVESPVGIDIVSGKSVELSDSTMWLRIPSLTTKPKDSSVLPLTLYFRHSPNAQLQISMSGSKSGIGSWFGK